MYQASACRALVVEDHDASREALRRLLRALGHEVDGVASIAEAERRLDSIGCLLLDLRLTDGNGIDLLRRIRTERRPIRVAVMTGSADEAMLAQVEALRPERLFIKPVDFGKVVEFLRES